MNKKLIQTISLLSILFFFVGSMFCMNDILFPTLITTFKLTYFEATAVQMSFYIVYLIFPIPIALAIAKFGYRISIITAVLICAAGCLIFLPAYHYMSFTLCLTGLFVLSAGIVVLNVAVNPYASIIGNPQNAQRRINLVQVCSRVGYAAIPVVATLLIYRNGNILFHIPYLLIAASLILLALLMWAIKIPDIKAENNENVSFLSLFGESIRYKHLIFGVLAMFFYVGAESGIAGFFINYLKSTQSFSDEKAATYLSLYNVLASVFGFTSLWMLTFIKAHRLVYIFGSIMIVLMLFAIFTNSFANAYILISMGACLSFMFPTLFGLAIEDMKSFTNKASALINLAICGGGFFPPIQGLIADSFNIQYSYLIPMFCFMMIVLYALLYPKLKKAYPI